MVGKVAPYFAVGEHVHDFIALGRDVETQLLAEACAYLKDDERQLVLDNLHCGLGQMQYVLKVKTQAWQLCPWTLCGLAHPDSAIAKAHGQKILGMFANSQQLQSHHRDTQRFMVDPICSQLRAWSSDPDVRLSQFPELSAAVMPKFVMPLFERGGERLHSILRRGTEFKQVSGPYVSLVLRIVAWTQGPNSYLSCAGMPMQVDLQGVL